MIKSDMGVVEIPKNKALCMTDFSTIVNTINKFLIESGLSEDEAKKEIEKAVNIGFMSAEEVDKEVMKRAEELGEITAILARIILDQMI